MASDKIFRGPVPVRPGERAPGAAGGPASVGVPLVKLIRRSLLEAPDLAVLSQKRSLATERFRRLKTLLVNMRDVPTQVIVVTSPAPREGKSTVSVNLALAFATDQTERTLLVDADLRRPTIGNRLHPAPRLGLTDVLAGGTALEHVVLTLENSTLEIIPAGAPSPDPVELLSSEHARRLVATLRERYQRVIIDTPPIVPFTDADAIGAHADGVLIVVRAGSTSVPSYRQAVQAVTSTRVFGAVMNDATFTLADWNRYSDYEYTRYYDEERTP